MGIITEIEVLFYDTYHGNYMKYFTDIYDEMNGRGYDKTNRSKVVPYLDKMLAHELTHAAMASKINYFHFLPTYNRLGN